MIDLSYEYAAMHGEQLPSSLTGVDVLTFYALCFIYEQYKNGNLSKERGSALKRKVIEAYEHTKRFSKKYEGMWQRTEEAARNYAKEPTIENADSFFASVYSLPNDWRLKR